MSIVAAAFVLTLTFVLTAYWVFVVRPERRAQHALWRRLKSTAPTAAVSTELLKPEQQLSAVPRFDAFLGRGHGFVKPVELLIEQSGARITVGAFLLASGLCGLIVALVVYRLTGMLLVSIPLGALGSMIPTSILRFLRTRRLLKFEEQFPEALDLMSRALKAGHAFTTGLGMIAEEMPKPIGPEFKLLHDHQNFGMPLADALKEFARRIPVLDARFFVTAVLIHREAGGNLSEILDNLGSVIRDRFKIKRQIRVISAHGRMTGWVLVAVPPALAFALFLVNPSHLKTLMSDPLGIKLIITAIVLQITGTLIIRKLVRIQY
jgi:tight adherence protein B